MIHMSGQTVPDWPWYSTWAILQAKNRLEKWQVEYSFSSQLIQTHGWVVEASTMSRARWVQFLQDAETSCLPSVILCFIPVLSWKYLQLLGHIVWHWTSQWTDTYTIALLCSLPFFSLKFFSSYRASVAIWQCFNMNILLPLLWNTWSRALGQDLATGAGLAHGQIIAFV